MEFDKVDDTQGEPPAEYPGRFQGMANLQRLPNPFTDGPALFAVHFEAGARTKPHVHHSGQFLYIVAGRGMVGDSSGRREVGPGEVVAAQPGEWHWHGATPDSPMTHLTVQLSTDPVDWDVDERDWAEGYAEQGRVAGTRSGARHGGEWTRGRRGGSAAHRRAL